MSVHDLVPVIRYTILASAFRLVVVHQRSSDVIPSITLNTVEDPSLRSLPSKAFDVETMADVVPPISSWRKLANRVAGQLFRGEGHEPGEKGGPSFSTA